MQVTETSRTYRYLGCRIEVQNANLLLLEQAVGIQNVRPTI